MGREESGMNKLTERSEIRNLTVLFVCVYMISYITRINFGAIISEMQRATAIPKSQLSMALTGSFITYGTGQVISGITGDRISPKKMISCGFMLTVLMNIAMVFCKNPAVMLVIWSINGFAQSFMWPPIVKIMTGLLNENDYKNAIAKVCWGSSIGTMLVYLISPVIISISSWKYVFLFSAVCGIGMFIIWQKSAGSFECPVRIVRKEKTETGNIRSILSPVILGVMAAIIFQGMLRDGVTTWMPSYISETYHLSGAISILSGVILPIFSIICHQAATKMYIRYFTNPLVCAGVFFLTGTVFAYALYCFNDRSVVCSILFSAVLTGCMHGVNLILICMIPPFYEKSGNVSTVSGVLNSCTYIGSALSTYGIAVLSESVGWQNTIFLWALAALIGFVVCMILVPSWKRKFGK